VLEGDFKRVVIIGHGAHNSTASAISANTKLELEGVYTWITTCSDFYSIDCEREVDRTMRVLKAVARIVKSRIGVVGLESKSEYDEIFEERFESELIPIDWGTLDQLISNPRRDLVDHFIEVVRRNVEFELPPDAIEEVGKLYAALRTLIEEKKLDAITIDCFPFIVRYRFTPCIPLAVLNSEGYVAGCEADVAALLLMMTSRELTGRSGWISNPSRFSGSYGYFAHCTVALDIAKKPRAVQHFETGNPYGLTTPLNYEAATMASISPDYSLIAFTKVKIERSGLLSNEMCRTQAVVRASFSFDVFPRIAVNNHHVFIPGDVVEELKAVASLLGIDYVTYEELATTL